MKFQINKGSNLCDDFVNMLRLPVEADGSEERQNAKTRNFKMRQQEKSNKTK